jgi:hypothetical protein
LFSFATNVIDDDGGIIGLGEGDFLVLKNGETHLRQGIGEVPG